MKETCLSPRRSTGRTYAVIAAKLAPPVLLAAVLLAGCGENADPVLQQGKAVWEGTCKVCHLNGIAGAPKMGDRAAWKDRIAQGTDRLINHALDGFKGREGEMPSRGGNPDLSDEEVAAAVEYMISQSQ